MIYLASETQNDDVAELSPPLDSRSDIAEDEVPYDLEIFVDRHKSEGERI